MTVEHLKLVESAVKPAGGKSASGTGPAEPAATAPEQPAETQTGTPGNQPARKSREQPKGPFRQRITAKQIKFAEEVAAGKTLSDAYRKAYPNKMTNKQIWESACTLASNPKVAKRIDEETAKLEQTRRMQRLRREEYVLEKLVSEAESAGTDGARVRALELLGKTAGMFTDRVEVDDGAERSAAELEDELARRLSALLGSEDETPEEQEPEEQEEEEPED